MQLHCCSFCRSAEHFANGNADGSNRLCRMENGHKSRRNCLFIKKISVVKVYGTLAQGFAAFLLSIIGYVSATSAQAVVQTDTVQQRIWIVYSIIPVIVRVVSSIPVFFYNIVGEERARMFNELKIKRNGPI